MGRWRGVLRGLRPEDRYGLYALLSFHDLPISKVPTLVADDHAAVKVQHHHGRTSQHPPGGLLNGEAFPLPADEVAVEDRPGRLQAEDLFELERLGQLPVKIFRPARLVLKLGVEPGEIVLQEAVCIFQSRDRGQTHLLDQPVLESGEGSLDPALGLR